MRGLMADQNGQMIEIPIIHNFKEGLTLTNYIIASYGARKGVIDTALKTADAGYLTRRLINTSNNILIRDYDCLTLNYIRIYNLSKQNIFINEIIGRTIAETIYDSKTNLFIIYKNTPITKTIAILLFNNIKNYIRVYSVLTCKLSLSLCQKCYG
jgi:DNA-directed RNA polymerase subunit beta'